MFILLLQIATTWSKNPLCGGRVSASKWVCWKGHTKSNIVGQPWPQPSGVKRADSYMVTTQAIEEGSLRC